MNITEIKWLLLVFGIVLLVVIFYRKAVNKVKKDQEAKSTTRTVRTPPLEKPKLTEDQFKNSWKSLSYLLLLAAAGNLYMSYTAVRSAIQPNGLWVWWIDAVFSLLAAVAAWYIWRKKEKLWVFIYFILLCVPIFLFMSIKGDPFKVSALIHLFPLVLLYFALKPVWENLKN